MGPLALLAALLGSAAVGMMFNGDDDAIDEVDGPIDPEPKPQLTRIPARPSTLTPKRAR